MEIIVLLLLMASIIYTTISLMPVRRRIIKSYQGTWKEKSLLKMKLKLITPEEFEQFCCDLLRLKGYNSQLTSFVADGGKDIVIYHDKNFETFVECKLYNSETDSVISRPICQKLIGSAKWEEKLKGCKVNCMIMTTSNFTKEAKEYCSDMDITMIDMAGIIKMADSVDINKVLVFADVTPGYLEEDIDEEIIYQDNFERQF